MKSTKFRNHVLHEASGNHFLPEIVVSGQKNVVKGLEIEKKWIWNCCFNFSFAQQARYNKKKRGPYKEAIRQAQSEARSQITPNSTTSGVLNVCDSPREVNVLS